MDDNKKSLSEETKKVSGEKEKALKSDDIKNALDKLDTKKAMMEKEVVEKIPEDTEKKESDSDKKEEKKESDSDKKEEKKESDSDKKEEKKESDSDKKEEKKESDSDKKEEKKDDNSDKKEESTSKALTQSKRIADAKAAQEGKLSEAGIATTTDKKEKKSKKGIVIFFSVVVALIAIVYVAGFVYFSNYFYPDVAINGTDVSNMDINTAKQTLDSFYKEYVLTLETIDGKQTTITGTDIAMNITLHDDFDECLQNQQAYLWFVNFMEHHDYTITAEATWDEKALETVYDEMKMLDKKLMTAPKDAYIGIQDGKFAIIKEELGTTINMDFFEKTVNDSLSKVVANVNLKDAGCYELPEVYDTDETLNSEFEAKSEYLGAVITLQLDDLTLEPGIELYDAVLQKSGDSYTISKTKVQQYVKELAEEYDTIGTERTFTTSFNNKKATASGTAFGYEMDQEATANALYNALQAKKTTTVEAIFKNKGYTLQGENDIGDTYIEVNLSEQYVVAYKDGKKIVEGDCVSGCEANGNGTCLGLYKIQDKLSPTVLRGKKKEVTKTVTKKNKKGKKVKVKETTMEYEYESPVTFWLQFNGGYGLHDAAGWRSVYGGSIYYYSGSHGCVNLPYDVAEKLYENFEVGDPVIVYFWDNENRK